MRTFNRIKNFIVHTIMQCPDEDLYESKRGKMKCRKCEREYFVFKKF